MAIENADDRAYFFDGDDWAVESVYGDSTVKGILIKDQAVLDGEVIAAQPRFICRTSDVSSIAEDDTLTIDGTSYAVRNRLDDGTGVTTLELRNA